jgi:2-oxoglutarate dehydrogenase E1 component
LSSKLEQFYQSSHLYGGNASLIEAYYEAWLDDPASVPQQWASVFESIPGDSAGETGHLDVQDRFRDLRSGPAPVVDSSAFADHKQAGVLRMINAFRVRGHENANLDPLGMMKPEPVPDLELAFHDLDESYLDEEFDTGSLAADQRMKLRDIVALCRRVYTQSIGAEFMHIVDTTKRVWLEQRLEGSRGEFGVSKQEKLRILEMLTAAEGLEKYLHTRYVGQKRFSLEGGDSLIPLLHETMLHAGTQGIQEIVMGMAHRGRLNVLVNILGKSPSMLFDEFDGVLGAKADDHSGDVKYHLGFASDITRVTSSTTSVLPPT